MRLAIWFGGTAVAAAMVYGAVAVQAQKGGGGCKDVPVRWYIYPVATLSDGSTTAAAIQGDGNWYPNGSIHRCGANPTYDATMVVQKSRRVSFTFGAPVSGSELEESLAAGLYQNSPFLNVRNLLCVGCADPSAPFTTHLALQLYGIGRQD